MGDLSAVRRELEAELAEVTEKEQTADADLSRLLQSLNNSKRGFQGDAHAAGSLAQSMAKIESFTPWFEAAQNDVRSEEHTSELQSLMRNSYAVFCLKKKKHNTAPTTR